jgi:hypothetical protein
MSDETTFSDVQSDSLVKKILSTPEGRFFSIFVAVAVFGWVVGMGSFQMNEMKIKNEIAAAERLAEEEEAARLTTLNEAFSSSEYSKYDYSSGDFKYYYDLSGNCKTSKPCGTPVILSKYNCESADFEFTFTKKSGEVISTVYLTETFVSSLSPFDLYVESTNNKRIDYINLVSATCNGESF